MTVKVNKKAIRGKLNKTKLAIIKESRKVLPDALEKIIVEDHILKGKSPVSGKGKFKAYSRSYKKQIRSSRLLRALGKRARPVNLKVSGQMLSTFFVKFFRTGFSVGFTDDVAKYHNEGTSNMPQRKMLPTGPKDRFNRRINQQIREILKRITRTVLRRRSGR